MEDVISRLSKNYIRNEEKKQVEGSWGRNMKPYQ